MKRKQIAIVGGGFAGVWASLGAAYGVQSAHAGSRVRITLVSPGDALVIRPRLYESDLRGVRVPLGAVLSPLGIDQRRSTVETIDGERRTLTLGGESPGELVYDQLVLCPGSRLRLPPDGGDVHSADSFEQAVALQRAVAGLADRSQKRLRATVVGAGFTGLELAAELSDTLRGLARQAGATPTQARVTLVDQAASVAPEFGPRARGVIAEALRALGVRIQTGVAVSRVDAGGVTLADGERIDSELVVWAAGPRASVLNEQLGVALDGLGRVPVGPHLETEVDGVWAAGDSARADVDGQHVALMSCQHAMPQGRQAGANAAAVLLGRALVRYRQPLYLTCLDLGSAGALLTCGFDRNEVLASGEPAKRFKRLINRSLIYPPAGGNPAELLKLGHPAIAGHLGAALQARALRSDRVRAALIARSHDQAARYAAPEG